MAERRRVHLDTWAAMGILLGGKYAKVLGDIMRRSGAGSYSLAVSQDALGEADAVILRRGPGAARMLLQSTQLWTLAVGLRSSTFSAWIGRSH